MQQLNLFDKNNPGKKPEDNNPGENAKSLSENEEPEEVVANKNEQTDENEISEEDLIVDSSEDNSTIDETLPLIEDAKSNPLIPKPSITAKRGRKSYKETDIDVALLDVPDEETLAKKQYYSISEVAEWFHVNTSLVRFWEKEFDILKPRKNRKGDRLFRPEDVKNLRIIYYLLRQQKYSIEGARQYLKENKRKVEVQVQLAEALTKFRSFLLELKSNLGS